MKIKTITKQLGYSEDFDNEVNAAIADGWVLTKREVLQPPAQPNNGSHYLHTMLYAELEKRSDVIIMKKGEDNYKCGTCGHFDDISGYCDNCRRGNKWEGAT